jgi:acyl-CoA thioesterase
MSNPAVEERREAGEPRTEFERATRAEPLGDSRYAGTMDAGWFGPPGPNGGVIAALILRAMRAEIAAPDRLPRSLTLHYLRPPAEGDVEVEVAIERSGRSATTCSARMYQGDRLATIALCVLTSDYEGMESWEPAPPAAPPPSDVPELSIPGTPPPMFARLETRPAFGSTPFSGGPEAVTGGWLRTRDGDLLGPELVALYTDAWWPAPFSRLDAPSMAPTLELTIHFRAKPSPGDEYALVHFRSEASIDGLFEEQGEVWSGDGRLLAQSRQLALLRPWEQAGA